MTVRFFHRVCIHCLDGDYPGTVVGFMPGKLVIVELDDERGTLKLPLWMFEPEP